MPEDRKYDYGYDGDGGPDNGNDGDLSEWIPVLIFWSAFRRWAWCCWCSS